jgi:DNA-binding MarR family transcriptional regulator
LENKHLVKFPRARPEESLGFMLWQTGNLWQRKMVKALRPTDLTLVQFALLAGIGWLERTTERITQVRLARYVNIDVMMTSQVLRRLESRGLVSKKASESDSRANAVMLTERGANLVTKALGLVQSVESDFFQSLESSHDEFMKLLGSLVETNESEKEVN